MRALLFKDRQIRGFLIGLGLIALTSWIVLTSQTNMLATTALRKALFNITSIISGTGYTSADYMQWGGFMVTLFFLVGLIGGCAGSTSCSIKIFRYQLAFASISTQLRRIRSPNGVFQPRYDGRKVDEDVLTSVMSFFTLFMVTLAVVATLLGLTGLDFITSLSAASAALANIGPGLGDQIGPAGNFAGLNDASKWILSIAMLIGRLELLAVYTLLTLKFWRA